MHELQEDLCSAGRAYFLLQIYGALLQHVPFPLHAIHGRCTNYRVPTQANGFSGFKVRESDSIVALPHSSEDVIPPMFPLIQSSSVCKARRNMINHPNTRLSIATYAKNAVIAVGPPFGVSQTYIWGIISIFIQNTSSSTITVILGAIGTVLPKLFEKWCGYSCTFPSAPARSSHLHRWVCVTFCVVQVLEGLLRLCRVWKAFKRFLFSYYWQTMTGNDIGSPNFMPTFAAPSDLPDNMFQWMPLTRVLVLSRFLPPLLAQSCVPSPRLFSSSEASAYLHYGAGPRLPGTKFY